MIYGSWSGKNEFTRLVGRSSDNSAGQVFRESIDHCEENLSCFVFWSSVLAVEQLLPKKLFGMQQRRVYINSIHLPRVSHLLRPLKFKGDYRWFSKVEIINATHRLFAPIKVNRSRFLSRNWRVTWCFSELSHRTVTWRSLKEMTRWVKKASKLIYFLVLYALKQNHESNTFKRKWPALTSKSPRDNCIKIEEMKKNWVIIY